MVSTLNYNPQGTTNAYGSFGVQSGGFIQGVAQDDPSARFALSGGVLASTETLPMWGGVAIGENIPGVANNPVPALGGTIIRATTVATFTGLSVFNQAHHMINTPTSQVPVALSGQSVNFYRFGSGIRVPVNVAPSLVSLEGGLITQQVSWDFTNSELVPYTAAYGNTTITGATWANTSGGQVTFTVGTDLSAILSAGSVIDVINVVNTGGTATNVYNGNFVVVSVTSTTIVVTYPAASSPGTYASGGTVVGGGGAFAGKVLDFNFGNSMTVSYNAVTGVASWNRSGNCALVLL